MRFDKVDVRFGKVDDELRYLHRVMETYMDKESARFMWLLSTIVFSILVPIVIHIVTKNL
jgi:hypothetical protein